MYINADALQVLAMLLFMHMYTLWAALYAHEAGVYDHHRHNACHLHNCYWQDYSHPILCVV